jgi:hypothetical protein
MDLSSSDKLCNANEAYQFLIRKSLRSRTNRNSGQVFERWQLAGGKTNRALGVLESLTAAHTAKLKLLEEEKKANLFCFFTTYKFYDELFYFSKKCLVKKL